MNKAIELLDAEILRRYEQGQLPDQREAALAVIASLLEPNRVYVKMIEDGFARDLRAFLEQKDLPEELSQYIELRIERNKQNVKN